MRKLILVILILALTIGLCCSVSVSAAEADHVPLETEAFELTFSNGITVNFPFPRWTYSCLVAFAGSDSSVVYIVEAANQLLNHDSIVGCMGVQDNGTNENAFLAYLGTVYLSAYPVVNGRVDFSQTNGVFREKHTTESVDYLLRNFVCTGVSVFNGFSGAALGPGDEFQGTVLVYDKYKLDWPADPTYVSGVSITSPPSPYYPGKEYQFQVAVSGTNLDDLSSTYYLYVRGNTSPETTISDDGLLSIANDETAVELDIEAVSTFDSTKSAIVTVPVTYPLTGIKVQPSGPEYLTESQKPRSIQYGLYWPNGDLYEYMLLEWSTSVSDSDYAGYFRIDDNGLLEIMPGVPAGVSCVVHWAYQHAPDQVSPVTSTVKIVTTDEGIKDDLDDLLHGDHGFDPGGSDFSGAADDLQHSQQQMQGVMSGGMGLLGNMMQSSAMVGTLSTLGSAFGAVFEGHEITICGVTANPFTLLVSVLGVAVLLLLALNYIFRKRGG